MLSRGFDSATAGDFAVAEVMTICWSMCLLTYSSLHLAIKQCSGVAAVGAIINQLDLSSRANPRDYCTRIAETVGIFSPSLAGTMFSKSAAFPMGTALAYLISSEGLGSSDARTLLSLLSKRPQDRVMGKFIKGSVREWPVPTFRGIHQ